VIGFLSVLVISSFFALVYWADQKSRKPFDFTDKVVIITGASSGIGEVVAYQLSKKKNIKLVLVARREDQLKNVVKKCEELGASKVLPFIADVSLRQSNKDMVEFTIKSFGRLDAIILNAGRGSLKTFKDLNESDLDGYRDIMEVNYWGCVYGTFFALPNLLTSKGRIIVVSSLAGKIGPPTRTGYAPTKHALHGFFASLRCEVGSDVGITIVCPSFVLSEIHDKAFGVNQEKGVKRSAGSFMSTEECARIVVESAELGKREELLTPAGKVGCLLMPFIPHLLDQVAIRKSNQALDIPK